MGRATDLVYRTLEPSVSCPDNKISDFLYPMKHDEKGGPLGTYYHSSFPDLLDLGGTVIQGGLSITINSLVLAAGVDWLLSKTTKKCI